MSNDPDFIYCFQHLYNRVHIWDQLWVRLEGKREWRKGATDTSRERGEGGSGGTPQERGESGGRGQQAPTCIVCAFLSPEKPDESALEPETLLVDTTSDDGRSAHQNERESKSVNMSAAHNYK